MNGKKLNKIHFISEIASTHNGSVKLLSKLTNRILNSNTDFIKFQVYQNEYLCHPSSKFYKNLKKIEIKQSFWKKIILKSIKKKKVILEPFDENSYDFCKKFKKKTLLKISSSEHDNFNMIGDALKNFNKVFFNISGFKLSEVSKLVKKYKKYKNKIVLLYGFQSFPSNPKDLRMNMIKNLKKEGLKVGYADHSITNDEILSYLLTAKAIELGATFIEKHITLNRSQKKPDYISSFEPNIFSKYVDYFKNNHIVEFNNKISRSEKRYCDVMEKFAFAKERINKDDKVSSGKFKFLRSSKRGLKKNDLKDILMKNMYFSKSYKKNEIIKKQYFKK